MFFLKLKDGERHKFVRELKRYLNELVQPTPKLPDDDVFDATVRKAIADFKKQWMAKNNINPSVLNNLPEADVFTWSFIGAALGNVRLRKELAQIQDYELRTLLIGMDAFANEVSYYSQQMENCDAKIALTLGGKNAIAAANGFEPEGIALTKAFGFYRGDTRNVWRNGTVVIGQGHLSRHIMHLYGSTDGTRFGVDGKTSTDIVIPNGFEMISSNNLGGSKNALTKIPTPTQAVVTFYYKKKLGNVENVTLLLMHVKNFKPVKQGNRWRIGEIGGRGGEIGNVNSPYLHSHFVLLKGDVGLAAKTDRNGKVDDNATSEYRASIGVRFVDAFC